ncbi:MAG: S41 family peptidase [Planctomycetota bacterium]
MPILKFSRHSNASTPNRVGRVKRRLCWLALMLGSVGGLGTEGFAQQPLPESVIAEPIRDSGSSVEDVLVHGRELEDAEMWAEAVAHYEKHLREHPTHVELYQSMVRSRLNFDVGRRMRDDSYLQMVRSQSVASALDLYDETLANLQTHYVDSMDWSRVLLHGTAALEVALMDPAFVASANIPVDAAKVQQFHDNVYSRIRDRSTQTRHDLRGTVANVALRAETELGVSGSFVVMEFLAGAISTLDSYTRLLSPTQLDEMFSNIEGNFVGLGLELQSLEQKLQIVSVIPGGPAEQAGIKGGERIIAVNQTSTYTDDPTRVADLLRGPEGSVVEVEVESIDGETRTLSVPRRRVDVPCVENVHFVDVEKRIGYLRLTAFQKTTTRDVEKALWQLHREGMRSLIVDVRGNPGGLLSAAVEVADYFVERGGIVSTRGRNTRETYDYRAHSAGTWHVPLAVLIDENSASASEIFAGAIADHQRGAIIGETSYGKGSVQGIFRMHSGPIGLCLTTARFYSPTGRQISHNGIEPTVNVPSRYIAARPDESGRIVTDERDEVLQRAIESLRGPRAAQVDEGWKSRSVR